MLSSSVSSSSSYGSVKDGASLSINNNNDNSSTPIVSKTNVYGVISLWKSLSIGLFLIIAVCVSIYYFGGFNGNNNNSIHGSHGGSGSSSIDNINKNVMSDITDKYIKAMESRNQQTSLSDSTVDAQVTCSSLREQLNEETQEKTHEFLRYYSNELNDYLVTVFPDEVDIAGDSYRRDGSAGYLWGGELPDVTVPLYRYVNEDCNGNDHFFTTVQEYYGSSRWQQISGFVMTQECSFNQPLYEYYSESTCDHYYTVNYRDYGNGNDNFEYKGIVGYVAKE